MSDAVLSLQVSHQGELVWLDLFTGGWHSLPTSAFDANLLLTDEFIPYFFSILKFYVPAHPQLFRYLPVQETSRIPWFIT